mmetsp:Transcript_16503/g.32231  ORF Transcript_16503/g.32231 Transcript_16503/m.32231 type:complete len:94 (+) Transcript_16503:576-857(+)
MCAAAAAYPPFSVERREQFFLFLDRAGLPIQLADEGEAQIFSGRFSARLQDRVKLFAHLLPLAVSIAEAGQADAQRAVDAARLRPPPANRSGS